jgi:hypothetical protein
VISGQQLADAVHKARLHRIPDRRPVAPVPQEGASGAGSVNKDCSVDLALSARRRRQRYPNAPTLSVAALRDSKTCARHRNLDRPIQRDSGQVLAQRGGVVEPRRTAVRADTQFSARERVLARPQVVRRQQRRGAIDLSHCRWDSQEWVTIDHGKRRHCFRYDVDGLPRSKLSHRQRMNPAQRLFVQNGSLASIQRVFVRFPRLDF